MSKVFNKLRITQLPNDEGQSYEFYCPGCKEIHKVKTGSVRPAWEWNGSSVSPTFTPSVLVQTGHYVPGQQGKRCWCDYNKEHPEKNAPFNCAICHSFVRDGDIQFLSDCTHELAGQTVSLSDFPT